MSTRLRDHLVEEHGRDRRDLDGLPLAGVHRLEHVEAEMGLVHLHHVHRTRGRVAASAHRNSRRRSDL
jgi:hypothetical protein